VNHDAEIRLAAFNHLERLTRGRTAVPASEISSGFGWHGQQVHLLTKAKGIFKPAQMRSVLSIKTIHPREGRPTPYHDAALGAGSFEYKFRGSDPSASDNLLLREAWEEEIPLIYFKAAAPAVYEVLWPVFIKAWDPERLACVVQTNNALLGKEWSPPVTNIEKAYQVREIRQRLHQGAFRAMVLTAYDRRCAMCGLPTADLLEAAHILEDSEPDSQPVISNGLCLCTLHHRAYDRALVGVDAESKIHVNRRIIMQTDGPVFQHGLIALADQPLSKPGDPEDNPSPDLLARRFEEFLAN
jgi:putative restriction endonuclease